MAGALFLLPRLATIAPFLALPLSVAGLFAAAPLVLVRVSGRLVHAVLALLIAILLISVTQSPESAVGFFMMFGLWSLVAGEVLARRRSVVAGCAAGFAVLSLELLVAAMAEGTAPMETTLRSPPVQAAFDQWAAQVPLGATEAKAAVEGFRAAILTLYPSLSVVSAAIIVTLNAIALGRIVQRRRIAGFPKEELVLFRWPLALVMAFVASGALLLVPDLHAVAWNGLVVTMFLFLLQGLSVLGFALVRLFSSELMRIFVVVASLLGPWAIFLSLLGLFDQWFDFRSRVASPAPPADPSNQNLQ